MPEPDPARRLTLLRRIAALCTLLVLAVTSLSAYLRLDKAGLGCADWPACYGAALRAQQGGASAPARIDSGAVVAARIGHRFAAVAVLAAIIAMLVLALGGTPVLRTQAVLAAVLLLLAIGLAVLGRYSADVRVPAVTIGNLLGGLAMLALAARLSAAGASAPPRRAPGTPGRDAASPAPGAGRADRAAAGLRAGAVALLGLVLVQAALGGLASASYAGLACGSYAECWRAAGTIDTAALDPWREPRIAAAGGAAAAGATVQLLHRSAAAVVTFAAAALTVVAWRRGRRGGASWLAALVAAELALGFVLVHGALPLGAALLHNIVTALLVVLLARLR
jgi:cytochrome c oxidase assembly protein subunit 15